MFVDRYILTLSQITTLEADNQHLEEVKNTLELSETKLKIRVRDNISEQEDALKSLKTSNRSDLICVSTKPTK